MTIRFLKLSLASSKSIKSWTERVLPNGKKVGKIFKGDLIDYKNGLPVRDGLSCERIFGPMVSFTCSCGRFKGMETRGIHIVHDTLRVVRQPSSVSYDSEKPWVKLNNLENSNIIKPSFIPSVTLLPVNRWENYVTIFKNENIILPLNTTSLSKVMINQKPYLMAPPEYNHSSLYVEEVDHHYLTPKKIKPRPGLETAKFSACNSTMNYYNKQSFYVFMINLYNHSYFKLPLLFVSLDHEKIFKQNIKKKNFKLNVLQKKIIINKKFFNNSNFQNSFHAGPFQNEFLPTKLEINVFFNDNYCLINNFHTWFQPIKDKQNKKTCFFLTSHNTQKAPFENLTYYKAMKCNQPLKTGTKCFNTFQRSSNVLHVNKYNHILNKGNFVYFLKNLSWFLNLSNMNRMAMIQLFQAKNIFSWNSLYYNDIYYYYRLSFILTCQKFPWQHLTMALKKLNDYLFKHNQYKKSNFNHCLFMLKLQHYNRNIDLDIAFSHVLLYKLLFAAKLKWPRLDTWPMNHVYVLTNFFNNHQIKKKLFFAFKYFSLFNHYQSWNQNLKTQNLFVQAGPVSDQKLMMNFKFYKNPWINKTPWKKNQQNLPKVNVFFNNTLTSSNSTSIIKNKKSWSFYIKTLPLPIFLTTHVFSKKHLPKPQFPTWLNHESLTVDWLKSSLALEYYWDNANIIDKKKNILLLLNKPKTSTLWKNVKEKPWFKNHTSSEYDLEKIKPLENQLTKHKHLKKQNIVDHLSPPRPAKVYKFKTFPPEEIRYCPQCEVELLPNSIRRYRLGYIEFISPVAHIWYMSSAIPLLLNLSKTLVESIASCISCLSPGFPPLYRWSYNGEMPLSWTFQMQPLSIPISIASSLNSYQDPPVVLSMTKKTSPKDFHASFRQQKQQRYQSSKDFSAFTNISTPFFLVQLNMNSSVKIRTWKHSFQIFTAFKHDEFSNAMVSLNNKRQVAADKNSSFFWPFALEKVQATALESGIINKKKNYSYNKSLTWHKFFNKNILNHPFKMNNNVDHFKKINMLKPEFLRQWPERQWPETIEKKTMFPSNQLKPSSFLHMRQKKPQPLTLIRKTPLIMAFYLNDLNNVHFIFNNINCQGTGFKGSGLKYSGLKSSSLKHALISNHLTKFNDYNRKFLFFKNTLQCYKKPVNYFNNTFKQVFKLSVNKGQLENGFFLNLSRFPYFYDKVHFMKLTIINLHNKPNHEKLKQFNKIYLMAPPDKRTTWHFYQRLVKKKNHDFFNKWPRLDTCFLRLNLPKTLHVEIIFRKNKIIHSIINRFLSRKKIINHKSGPWQHEPFFQTYNFKHEFWQFKVMNYNKNPFLTFNNQYLLINNYINLINNPQKYIKPLFIINDNHDSNTKTKQTLNTKSNFFHNNQRPMFAKPGFLRQWPERQWPERQWPERQWPERQWPERQWPETISNQHDLNKRPRLEATTTDSMKWDAKVKKSLYLLLFQHAYYLETSVYYFQLTHNLRLQKAFLKNLFFRHQLINNNYNIIYHVKNCSTVNLLKPKTILHVKQPWQALTIFSQKKYKSLLTKALAIKLNDEQSCKLKKVMFNGAYFQLKFAKNFKSPIYKDVAWKFYASLCKKPWTLLKVRLIANYLKSPLAIPCHCNFNQLSWYSPSISTLYDFSMCLSEINNYQQLNFHSMARYDKNALDHALFFNDKKYNEKPLSHDLSWHYKLKIMHYNGPYFQGSGLEGSRFTSMFLFFKKPFNVYDHKHPFTKLNVKQKTHVWPKQEIKACQAWNNSLRFLILWASNNVNYFNGSYFQQCFKKRMIFSNLAKTSSEYFVHDSMHRTISCVYQYSKSPIWILSSTLCKNQIIMLFMLQNMAKFTSGAFFNKKYNVNMNYKKPSTLMHDLRKNKIHTCNVVLPLLKNSKISLPNNYQPFNSPAWIQFMVSTIFGHKNNVKFNNRINNTDDGFLKLYQSCVSSETQLWYSLNNYYLPSLKKSMAKLTYLLNNDQIFYNQSSIIFRWCSKIERMFQTVPSPSNVVAPKGEVFLKKNKNKTCHVIYLSNSIRSASEKIVNDHVWQKKKIIHVKQCYPHNVNKNNIQKMAHIYNKHKVTQTNMLDNNNVFINNDHALDFYLLLKQHMIHDGQFSNFVFLKLYQSWLQSPLFSNPKSLTISLRSYLKKKPKVKKSAKRKKSSLSPHHLFQSAKASATANLIHDNYQHQEFDHKPMIQANVFQTHLEKYHYKVEFFGSMKIYAKRNFLKLWQRFRKSNMFNSYFSELLNIQVSGHCLSGHCLENMGFSKKNLYKQSFYDNLAFYATFRYKRKSMEKKPWFRHFHTLYNMSNMFNVFYILSKTFSFFQWPYVNSFKCLKNMPSNNSFFSLTSYNMAYNYKQLKKNPKRFYLNHMNNVSQLATYFKKPWENYKLSNHLPDEKKKFVDQSLFTSETMNNKKSSVFTNNFGTNRMQTSSSKVSGQFQNNNYYGCMASLTNWGSDHASWILFLKYMRATILKGDFLLHSYFDKTLFQIMPRTGSVMLEQLLSELSFSSLPNAKKTTHFVKPSTPTVSLSDDQQLFRLEKHSTFKPPVSLNLNAFLFRKPTKQAYFQHLLNKEKLNQAAYFLDFDASTGYTLHQNNRLNKPVYSLFMFFFQVPAFLTNLGSYRCGFFPKDYVRKFSALGNLTSNRRNLNKKHLQHFFLYVNPVKWQCYKINMMHLNVRCRWSMFPWYFNYKHANILCQHVLACLKIPGVFNSIILNNKEKSLIKTYKIKKPIPCNRFNNTNVLISIQSRFIYPNKAIKYHHDQKSFFAYKKTPHKQTTISNFSNNHYNNINRLLSARMKHCTTPWMKKQQLLVNNNYYEKKNHVAFMHHVKKTQLKSLVSFNSQVTDKSDNHYRLNSFFTNYNFEPGPLPLNNLAPMIMTTDGPPKISNFTCNSLPNNIKLLYAFIIASIKAGDSNETFKLNVSKNKNDYNVKPVSNQLIHFNNHQYVTIKPMCHVSFIKKDKNLNLKKDYNGFDGQQHVYFSYQKNVIINILISLAKVSNLGFSHQNASSLKSNDINKVEKNIYVSQKLATSNRQKNMQILLKHEYFFNYLKNIENINNIIKKKNSLFKSMILNSHFNLIYYYQNQRCVNFLIMLINKASLFKKHQLLKQIKYNQSTQISQLLMKPSLAELSGKVFKLNIEKIVKPNLQSYAQLWQETQYRKHALHKKLLKQRIYLTMNFSYANIFHNSTLDLNTYRSKQLLFNKLNNNIYNSHAWLLSSQTWPILAGFFLYNQENNQIMIKWNNTIHSTWSLDKLLFLHGSLLTKNIIINNVYNRPAWMIHTCEYIQQQFIHKHNNVDLLTYNLKNNNSSANATNFWSFAEAFKKEKLAIANVWPIMTEPFLCFGFFARLNLAKKIKITTKHNNVSKFIFAQKFRHNRLFLETNNYLPVIDHYQLPLKSNVLFYNQYNYHKQNYQCFKQNKIMLTLANNYLKRLKKISENNKPLLNNDSLFQYLPNDAMVCTINKNNALAMAKTSPLALTTNWKTENIWFITDCANRHLKKIILTHNLQPQITLKNFKKPWKNDEHNNNYALLPYKVWFQTPISICLYQNQYKKHAWSSSSLTMKPNRFQVNLDALSFHLTKPIKPSINNWPMTIDKHSWMVQSSNIDPSFRLKSLLENNQPSIASYAANHKITHVKSESNTNKRPNNHSWKSGPWKHRPLFINRNRKLRRLRIQYLRNFRRLRFIEYLKATSIKQESMILSLLPVLPPDLRPVIANPRGYITGDINNHYQNVIYRNNNIERLLDNFWIPKKCYSKADVDIVKAFYHNFSYRPRYNDLNNQYGYGYQQLLFRPVNAVWKTLNNHGWKKATTYKTPTLENLLPLAIMKDNHYVSSKTILWNDYNSKPWINGQTNHPMNMLHVFDLKDYNYNKKHYDKDLPPLFFLEAKKNRTQILNDFKPLQEMQYSLQKAVDALIDNSQKLQSNALLRKGRPLKSLSESLKGKEGRFRQHLLGKRVDYSGRSVIIVGPRLKLYECGIPLIMALRLFQPFLILYLINRFKITSLLATQLIQRKHPLIINVLRNFIEMWPVLLNRAPTLHRMNIQAFKIKLVQGKAILLHPLVCSSYNADFDGDQMGVHIPITQQARAESWKLLWSINNSLSIASRQPLFLPSQDIVIGNYYLTQDPLYNPNYQPQHEMNNNKLFSHYHSPSTVPEIWPWKSPFNKQAKLNNTFNHQKHDNVFSSIKEAYQYYMNATSHYHVNNPIWFRSKKCFEVSEREKSIEIMVTNHGYSIIISKYYEKILKNNRLLTCFSSEFFMDKLHNNNLMAPISNMWQVNQHLFNNKSFNNYFANNYTSLAANQISYNDANKWQTTDDHMFYRHLNPICMNQLIRSTFGRIEFYYDAFQVEFMANKKN